MDRAGGSSGMPGGQLNMHVDQSGPPINHAEVYGEDEDLEEESIKAGPWCLAHRHLAGVALTFGHNFPKNFIVPERLLDKPYELIEAANDWHYAMMSDHRRRLLRALKHVVTPESVVLEIGAGSGLLSIIAATLGAKCVVAIEANRHLAAVAREIIRRNGHEDRVHIINKMSTDVEPDEILRYGQPTVLLSEILGTLLLGESALHYVEDARERLTPGAAVVPRRGAQFATLIESDDISSITSVRSWEGIDLGWFNTLQDTTSMVFTKQYGFRFFVVRVQGARAKAAGAQARFRARLRRRVEGREAPALPRDRRRHGACHPRLMGGARRPRRWRRRRRCCSRRVLTAAYNVDASVGYAQATSRVIYSGVRVYS